MMYKKLQKILAVTLMTSFLSTSMALGISEAAPARHDSGRGPAQQQQIRPEQKGKAPQAKPAMQKGSSGHAQPAMQRTNPGSHAKPPTQQSGSQQKAPAHKADPGSHAKPPTHNNGGHHPQPAIHKNGNGHHVQPAVHKGKDGYEHRGPVVQRHEPAPPRHEDRHNDRYEHQGPVIQHNEPAPTPRHHERSHKDNSDKVVGALIIGGIIGAILANA